MPPKKKKSNKWKDAPFIISFLAYPLLLFVVFYVYVNFSSILLAFKKYDFDGSYTWVGFENFQKFIDYISGSHGRWTIAFQNSLKMYIICLVCTLPLYILLSYILFKKCFGHGVWRSLVMIPQIISGFVMCLIFKRFIESAVPDFLMTEYGIEMPNILREGKYTFGTTIFYQCWLSFSTSLIVYPNAMNEIDDGIIEACHLDGVGNMFQELWYIIIPLIFPTISTFIITGFAAIFTNAGALPTFFMYSAPDESVNMGYLYWAEIANSSNYVGYPMLSAGGLLMTAIVAPLTLLIRHFLDKVDPQSDL